jgi:hypothetical protein
MKFGKILCLVAGGNSLNQGGGNRHAGRGETCSTKKLRRVN